mmetsp:Transcript_19293/g.44843  ORF Transcript_19293/g.44843 Transcript_19293/m.44843 type:complete len:1072 (+) Transcript_19293:201-3416(+)
MNSGEVMLVKSGEAPAGPVGAAGAPALGGTDVAEVEMKQKELVEGVRYDVADVISWLPSLGFDEDTTKTIQKLFRRNAVDGTKLAELDADELKKMGVEDPKHQNTILSKRPGGIKLVTLRALLRFADRTDMIIMTLGALGAMGQGFLLPLMTTFLGDLMTGLFSRDLDEAKRSVQATALIFLYLAIAMFVVGWIGMGFFATSAARQGAKIREEYLRAILRQDQAWFDQTKANQLSTRIAGDVPYWMDAIQSMAKAISCTTTFLAGITFGFVQGWQLALIILAAVPVLGACGAILGLVFKGMKKGQDAYAQAGGCAEETLGNMRTVASLGAEDELRFKYEGFLAKAYASSVKQAVIIGAGICVFIFCMFSTYSLSLWYGSTLITQQVMNLQTGEVWNGGDVLSTFFCILIGAMIGGEIGPVVEALTKGRGAAYRIIDTIDREVPKALDPFNEDGATLENISGQIEIESVSFTYPTRPGYPVFTGLSISVPVGKTVALVGSSGSGKSTVVALLQRFYLPTGGRITLDGHDISTLNLRWFRSQIGIVSQEPVLFSCSIKENILLGNEKATDQEIVAAAKVANACNFVTQLPGGFDTEVTNAQLSGGQKQRVAIARAVAKNPKILLLDEATSALDAKSEAEVQAALERCMQGRTTLIIAHRLSTVRNADRILVLNRGELEEQGTYQDLSTREGGAFRLLMHQQAGTVDQAIVLETADITVDPASIVDTLASPGRSDARPGSADGLQRAPSESGMGGTGVVVEDEKPKAEEVKGWDQARVQQWAGEVQLPGSLFDEEAVTATFSGVDGKALWGMSVLDLHARGPRPRGQAPRPGADVSAPQASRQPLSRRAHARSGVQQGPVVLPGAGRVRGHGARRRHAVVCLHLLGDVEHLLQVRGVLRGPSGWRRLLRPGLRAQPRLPCREHGPLHGQGCLPQGHAVGGKPRRGHLRNHRRLGGPRQLLPDHVVLAARIEADAEAALPLLRVHAPPAYRVFRPQGQHARGARDNFRGRRLKSAGRHGGIPRPRDSEHHVRRDRAFHCVHILVEVHIRGPRDGPAAHGRCEPADEGADGWGGRD